MYVKVIWVSPSSYWLYITWKIDGTAPTLHGLTDQPTHLWKLASSTITQELNAQY